MMALDSTRMKNDECRIPPCLSIYNHLGRKQITTNSSSDGLHEIHVLAEAEGMQMARKHGITAWMMKQQTRRQEEAHSRCLSQLRSLSCPWRWPRKRGVGLGQAGLCCSHTCHVLGGWRTAQHQNSDGSPEQFKSASIMWRTTKVQIKMFGLYFFFNG